MKKIKGCLSILMVLTILLSVGCGKKDSTTPTTTNNNNNNNNNPNTNPYYFRFTINGVTDTFTSDVAQSWSSSTNAIYGDVSKNTALTPDISLQFRLPYWYDTIKEADVLGLAGKTIYFNDTSMIPSVSYQPLNSIDSWDSNNTSDTSYNVKITSVSFLSTATYQGTVPVRTYVFTGTCRAQVSITGTDTALAGSFKMIIARVIY